MKAKKGISLIVLVITIIVIIILAGAVILSLQNNNPIEQAQKAQYVSDKDSIQSLVTLALSTKMAQTSMAYTVDVPTDKTYLKITGNTLPVISDSGTTDNITLGETLPTAGTWLVTKYGKVTYVVNGWDVSNNYSTGTAGNFDVNDVNIIGGL